MLKLISIFIMLFSICLTSFSFAQTVTPKETTAITPSKVQALKKMRANNVKKVEPAAVQGQAMPTLVVPNMKLLKKTYLRVRVNKAFPDGTSSIITRTANFKTLCELAVGIKVYDQNGTVQELTPRFAKIGRQNNDTCLADISLPTDANYTVDARLVPGKIQISLDRLYISPMQKDAKLTANNPSTYLEFDLSRRN